MFVPAKLKAVHFAVRFNVIGKYLGQLLSIVALLNLVPLAVSALHGRYDAAWRYGAIIALILAVAAPCVRLRAQEGLQRNEALVISALVFLMPPFLLAVPLMSYGIGYHDAVFEAISGITTTGLSVVGGVEDAPFPFHFSRAWMQWIGGLGVVVLSVAFLIEPGMAAKHLGFERGEVDDLVGGTRAHARLALIAYATVTAVGIGVLWLSGMTPADAVLHSLAAISTGGFSNYDDSLAGLGSAASRGAVIALCFAGALPLYLYYRARFRNWRSILADVQLQSLVLLTVLVTLVLSALLWRAGEGGIGSYFGDAALTAISAQTTAGFSALPYQDLDNAAIGLLIAAMLIGGGLGSTAGGIKLLRLVILLRFLFRMVLRCSVSASAYVADSVGGRRLGADELESAMAVIIGYIGVVFISFIVFLGHGQPALDSLFEVASAVGTVGLSSGLTGPDMAPALKTTLCINMLMGRVETVALIVFLFPGTWIGKRRRL
ncbi:MAG: TrkH family potassium uptake protein [Sphingomonadales bacterium]